MPIVIADHIVHATRLTRSEILREFAIMLYAQEKLTLGSAAELAEMPQFEFQLIAGGRGIAPHYNLADFEEDYALLQRRGIV